MRYNSWNITFFFSSIEPGAYATNLSIASQIWWRRSSIIRILLSIVPLQEAVDSSALGMGSCCHWASQYPHPTLPKAPPMCKLQWQKIKIKYHTIIYK